MRKTMKWGPGALTVLLLSAPLAAQAPDYLTEEEVQKARETQEPNKRILLFLEFAATRLERFEQALAAKPPASGDELNEIIDEFVSAVDDSASNLDLSRERGGLDLGKAREGIDKQGTEFLQRLEKIGESQSERLEEFRFTWEDAREATRDLLEAAKKIPEGMIPPKASAPVSAEEEKPEPGKPTLRKKEERKPPVPRPQPRPSGPPPEKESDGSA